MWSHLFKLVPTLRENVNFVMSDYEKAAMTAAQRSFENVRLHGCWFHYCQVTERSIIFTLLFFILNSIV